MDEPVLLDFDRSTLGDDPMIARHLIALPVLPSIALPPAASAIARRAWEERFDRLDDYLRELQSKETDGARSSKKENDHGRRKKR